MNGALVRSATSAALLLLAALLGMRSPAAAEQSAAPPASYEPDPSPPAPSPPPAASDSGFLTDVKLYFTAPVRWNTMDWAWFGGALLAVGASHHYDTQVRTHFLKNLAPGETINSDDVKDAIPTVAVMLATWAYAGLTDDTNGHRETWAMLEAAGLSSVTAYALKYVVAREGPDQTSDPNAWRKSGGSSFPSWHSSAAFAVGTVLAESGNDDYRWLRRVLGYGLGVATSYERLKHNAHWLSDTVAGATLGAATARFTMERKSPNGDESGLAIVPVQGGAMVAYRFSVH